MPRYALGVEYDGTDYYGWQTQHQEPTLQSTLEAALARVADERVTVVASGRTDTGVHASGQVVHFDTRAVRTERGWVLGTNCHLPSTMALRWARLVEPDFHSRFSAHRRRYRYRILRRATRPALEARLATWIRESLDVDAMRRAVPALIGEHDYTSFRTIACQSRTPMRRMHSVDFEVVGDRLDLVFEANAFLHHMVRNLVGSLLVVGRGERPPEWVGEVLAARDRRLAGPTAPPTGLVYEGPRYPARWGLPAEHCL
jgi:tRNA pseudouridine38-40 synthase